MREPASRPRFVNPATSLIQQKVKKLMPSDKQGLTVYDLEEKTLFYKSTELNENHRGCVTHEELIELRQGEHERDHRHAETCYSSLRKKYYPVVWEVKIALYKQFVKCQVFEKQASQPKTSIVCRTILATNQNSLRQMDPKKLPSCRGFEYVSNTVDCYPQFAMGGAIKSKTAKEVCHVILDCINSYGLVQATTMTRRQKWRRY